MSMCINMSISLCTQDTGSARQEANLWFWAMPYAAGMTTEWGAVVKCGCCCELGRLVTYRWRLKV